MTERDEFKEWALTDSTQLSADYLINFDLFPAEDYREIWQAARQHSQKELERLQHNLKCVKEDLAKLSLGLVDDALDGAYADGKKAAYDHCLMILEADYVESSS